MAHIAPPPPTRPPRPLFHILRANQYLVRIFDPTDHGTTATGFRYWGPRHRFDHNRVGTHASPAPDPDCGIYYAAANLAGCLVETFGAVGLIEFGEKCVAYPHLTRDLRLLDLRRRGAMRAGANAALAKVADRPLSQQWSRYFYDNAEVYSRIDGLVYFNAHNDAVSFALYERAADALECPPSHVIRLDHPALRPTIVRVALANNLIVPPAGHIT